MELTDKEQGLTADEIKKLDELIDKEKAAKFSGRTMMMVAILAFSKDNIGHEIETCDKFIDLIDKYPDEREFFKYACLAVGIR